MNSCLMQVDVTAELSQIRDLRKAIYDWCHGFGIDEQEMNNLQLVVSEFATNVIKHSQPKASHISMRVCDDETGWRLELHDNGGGYDGYKNLDSLMPFTPFELLESGMGLGLIHSLYPDHHYISGDTDNCFTLYLKSIKASDRKKIAIVDDEKVLQTLLATYLSDDYDVMVFADGSEALEVLAKKDVDLVISDINMPEMDGLSLRRLLERKYKTAKLPFIFLTSDEQDATLQRASYLGVDDFLVKPVNKQQLLSVVQRVLQRSEYLEQVIGGRLDTEITALLRPDLPKVLGSYRCAVASRTATSGGGDFIFQRSDGESTMVLLGDVMGHGDRAKFYAHAYAGYISGMLMGLIDSFRPDYVLNKLAKGVQNEDLLGSTMLTCVAFSLDKKGIEIAAAGHPQPWLVTDQGVAALNVGGGLLTFLQPDGYEVKKVSLNPHERLVFYTDGWLDEGARLGKQPEYISRIKRTLSETLNKPLDIAMDEIIAVFDEVCHSKPSDDATLIIVERNIGDFHGQGESTSR